ncbi:MAG: glycoside hydrolase family 9 protein [Cyanobacteria bacterium J06626_18]
MYTADLIVANDWATGFTANLVITNVSNKPITWSQLTFEAPFEITNLWNGEILNEDSGSYVIGSPGWGKTIAPGNSISIGFNGSKASDSKIEVTNLELDGVRETNSPAPTPDPEPPTDPVDPAPALNDAIRIEAEDYTDYSDKTKGNTGKAYRNDGVDLEATSDTGGGYNVGWIDAGEWLTYDVDITASGTYTLAARVASKQAGPFSMKAAINGQDTTLTFDGTGNWQDWTTVTGEQVTLTEGEHTLRLDMESDRFNLNYVELIPVEGNPTPDPNPKPAPDPDPGQDPDPDPDPTPDPDPSPNPSTGQFNYAEALQKSFLFYEAQRSGPLPDDNRIEWRGDSAVNDGADVGRDLSGGYYDAGDHVKFGFPMASSMTMLSWGVEEYRDAYSQIGQLDEALDAIKWGTDYILNAHVTDANGTKEFWGQVADGFVDHSYWGPPEEMTMERPSFKIDRQNPGTDLAAEAAAALASASIIFRPTNKAYADKLLENAEQLYEFADTYRGKYSDAIPNAQTFYNSWSGYNDELAWGAAWLYKATGKNSYLQKAESVYQNQIGGLAQGETISWDDKAHGAAVLLAQETGKQSYQQDVEGWLNSWVEGKNGIQVTDGGLRWLRQWGSNRYAANTAFAAGVYADTVNDPGGKFSDLSESTIDYLLGDNPRNSSYVVGFGENSPQQPHHRAAGSDLNKPGPNEHILYGALVGGPDKPNDFAYEDSRNNYITNEVALDYNAGFTGALARTVDVFGGDPPSDSELNALPGVVVPDTNV